METVKIYPTVEELATVSNVVYCTESGCSSVFKSESNLNLHLAKRHKKEESANLLSKQNACNREYYCPEKVCVYHAVKSFKTAKLLKQHFLKVHSKKDVMCTKCNKGFPTEKTRNIHEEYCGINFKCEDCDATYTCYDTLTTHGRRKKHRVLPKTSFKQSGCGKEFRSGGGSGSFILPKPSSSSEIFIIIRNDKGSQTDLRNGWLRCKSGNSIETQTGKYRQPQSCVETQTIGDYFPRKTSCDIVPTASSLECLPRKSTDTQTLPVTSTTKSCNTSFNESPEKTTLGTQTLTMLSNLLDYPGKHETGSELGFELMNTACQTSFTETLDAFESIDFFNNETQTDSMLTSDFDLLTPDFYANMCTQTFDAGMELNDIHTQTMIDDILKSVGSQTTKCARVNGEASSRDTAHIETQTDADFRQLLEEINA